MPRVPFLWDFPFCVTNGTPDIRLTEHGLVAEIGQSRNQSHQINSWVSERSVVGRTESWTVLGIVSMGRECACKACKGLNHQGEKSMSDTLSA